MLQANEALARRIERAETRLVVDMAESVARRSPQTDVLIAHLGGGAAVFAGPNSPLNKWVGLGFDEALDEARAAELEAEFARRKAAVRVELSAFADPAIAPLLAKRGYQSVGREDVLALELDASRISQLLRAQGAASGGIAVTTIDRGESRNWLDVVITGFLHPDGSAETAPTESFEREALEQAFSDSIEVQGFELHLASRGGAVAGGGGMRRFDGVAQLCGASTLPEHRGRGVQTALLRARLLAAARAGCDLALVTTEPGSRSQRNAEARGFQKVYSRAILVRF
jgi:GNAT superfamily N-acetyltransferase